MKKYVRISVSVLLMVVMLFSVMPMTVLAAESQTLYVSAAGNDTDGDGTQNNPYATIRKVYDESRKGDTIVLLSDIEQKEVVSIWHDVVIKSAEGHTYTVTRQSGFESTSGNSRSWYNPAMFEAHPDIAGTAVTIENIILDDNFLHEGTSFTDQPTAPADTSANLTRVQDGIVSLYSDPDDIYKCTVILGDGAKLQNFGGMSAVNVEGNSELIMKNGSEITNNGTSASGNSGVCVIGGSFIMENGAKIHDIKGPHAINMMPGTLKMDGIVENCSAQVIVRLAGGSTGLIGEHGIVRNNSVQNGAVYCFQGSVLTVKGEISGNTSNAGGRSAGIYAINNGANPTVYIENGAKIINNVGTDVGAGVLVGNGSTVKMNGGLISGNTNNGANASGVNIYGSGTFTMNGGEIKGNTINLGIGTKSQGWAYVNGGTIENGGTHDYYIQAKDQGYMSGGSYLYLSKENLASKPAVYFDTNAKKMIPAVDNTELYLGNASAAAKTALNNFVTTNYTGSTVLATWFAQTPENAFHATVSGIAAQTVPVYIISYPLNANGTVSDSADPIVYTVTQDTTATGNPIDVVASAGSTHGRAYALFAAPDMFNVTFDSQGGSAVPTEAVANGGTAHKPLDPTWKYRRFVNWYTEPECSNLYDFDSQITENTTLYAKWDFVTETVDLSKIKLFKNVEKDDSATYDEIAFEYKFEAVNVKPVNGTLSVADMPEIDPLTITMSGSETRQKVTLPDDIGFPLGGVYTYKVTETAGTEEDWTYDPTEYYIDLEIEEDSNGKLVLDKVVIHKEAEDGAKSEFEFTNIYAPKTDLEISKKVSGEEDNPLNKTKEFTFSITFTNSGLPGDVNVDGTETVVEYGQPYEFKLKDGESIKFNMPVGTTYSVTEQAEEYYTPSAKIITGGTDKGTTDGSYNTAITVGDTVQTGVNKAEFTNTYSITPPTGIALNTEIITIGIIILGLGVLGFIVSRKLRMKQ